MSISLTNVTALYENNKGISAHLNCQINQGDCVILCGKSGGGKTTFTQLINGLIPELFDGLFEGQVLVHGVDTSTAPIHTLTPFVGSVFQNPKSQFFTLNVKSELAFGCENMGVSLNEIETRLKEITQLFGISHLIDRKMQELSGGEKQLVAFASVYMQYPKILVLDEPSSNLDFLTIEKLAKILFHAKQQGTTLVISEHRLYYLYNLADYFLLVANGTVAQRLSREEFLALSSTEREQLGLRTLSLEKLSVPRMGTNTFPQEKLTLSNITYHYPKDKQTTITIPELTLTTGEILGILGPNGAGKTTLAKLITGLLAPKTGTISLNDTLQKRRALIANSFLVMQDVNYQLFCETVEKELLLNAKRKELFSEVVDTFQLKGILHRHPMSLSGGQKQRVAIASALLSGKKIIALDEPTSGLDLMHMLQVSKLLEHLKKMNCFVIMISHDIEFILQTCTQILTMQNGQTSSKEIEKLTSVLKVIEKLT